MTPGMLVCQRGAGSEALRIVCQFPERFKLRRRWNLGLGWRGVHRSLDAQLVSVSQFTETLHSLLNNQPDRLGIAVSGGMDSMALCTLLKRHREIERWPAKVFAYTIDHGVRPESSEEAESVAKLVTDMGFNHRILKLSTPMQQALQHKMPKNLETVLRRERLRLWSKVLQEDALQYVLTGHHQDDQYETILQRIAWGSGPAGLGGIPPVNDCFIRPLLAYPKTRLQATCEEYNVPWFNDYTNFEPTHAIRTAIRHIVRNQDDLPLALRKENILHLAERGRQYKEGLLDTVNSMLARCSFQRDTFTGGVKVQFPVSMIQGGHQKQSAARFIPALARIFRSGIVQPFNLLGIQDDNASDAIVEKFCEDKLRDRFNVFGLEFRKIPPSDHTQSVLYLAPEVPPRHKRAVYSQTVPITVLPDQTTEWKKTTFAFPVQWHQPWRIDVTVKEDRGYYFRLIYRLDSGVREYFKLHELGEREHALLQNSKKRSRYFPFSPLLVICHREDDVEKLDHLPRHGIEISDEIRAVVDTKFDLTTDQEQYVDMEWDPKLLKLRENHLKE